MNKKNYSIKLVFNYPEGEIKIEKKEGNIVLTSLNRDEVYLRIGNRYDPIQVKSIIEEFRERINSYLREIEERLSKYNSKEKISNIPKNSNYNPLRHW